MALQKYEAVPIDTHVLQITASIYLPHLMNKKSLNKANRKEIGMDIDFHFYCK